MEAVRYTPVCCAGAGDTGVSWVEMHPDSDGAWVSREAYDELNKLLTEARVERDKTALEHKHTVNTAKHHLGIEKCAREGDKEELIQLKERLEKAERALAEALKRETEHYCVDPVNGEGSS